MESFLKPTGASFCSINNSISASLSNSEINNLNFYRQNNSFSQINKNFIYPMILNETSQSLNLIPHKTPYMLNNIDIDHDRYHYSCSSNGIPFSDLNKIPTLFNIDPTNYLSISETRSNIKDKSLPSPCTNKRTSSSPFPLIPPPKILKTRTSTPFHARGYNPPILAKVMIWMDSSRFLTFSNDYHDLVGVHLRNSVITVCRPEIAKFNRAVQFGNPIVFFSVTPTGLMDSLYGIDKFTHALASWHQVIKDFTFELSALRSNIMNNFGTKHALIDNNNGLPALLTELNDMLNEATSRIKQFDESGNRLDKSLQHRTFQAIVKNNSAIVKTNQVLTLVNNQNLEINNLLNMCINKVQHNNYAFSIFSTHLKQLSEIVKVAKTKIIPVDERFNDLKTSSCNVTTKSLFKPNLSTIHSNTDSSSNITQDLGLFFTKPSISQATTLSSL